MRLRALLVQKAAGRKTQSEEAYAEDGKLTFQDIDLREKYRMQWRNPVYGFYY